MWHGIAATEGNQLDSYSNSKKVFVEMHCKCVNCLFYMLCLMSLKVVCFIFYFKQDIHICSMMWKF